MKSIDELLSLEGYEQLSILERWQLISQIDEQTDRLQKNWLGEVKPGDEASQKLIDQLNSLRRKRVQIWFSFNRHAPLKTAA